MPLYKGATRIGNLYRGSVKLGRAYRGDVLVYSSVPPEEEYEFVNAEAETLVNAMTVEPDDARKLLIDNTFTALKASGDFNTFDLFYIVAAHTEQAARLNWKNPAVGVLTAGGSFTPDVGFGSGALSTGVTINGSGQQAQKDNHCVLNYLGTSFPAGSGGSGTLLGARIGLRNYVVADAVNGFEYRAGSATDTIEANPGVTAPALYNARRNSSTNQQLRIYNGAAVVNDTGAVTSVADWADTLAATNVGIVGLRMFSVGSSLGNAAHNRVFNAVKAYMDGL